MSVAGMYTKSRSVREDFVSITVESTTSNPPLWMTGSNLSNDCRLKTIAACGSVTSGEAIDSSATTTAQLAVPPRCSGPYEGNQVTSLPSSMPACARSSDAADDLLCVDLGGRRI